MWSLAPGKPFIFGHLPTPRISPSSRVHDSLGFFLDFLLISFLINPDSTLVFQSYRFEDLCLNPRFTISFSKSFFRGSFHITTSSPRRMTTWRRASQVSEVVNNHGDRKSPKWGCQPLPSMAFLWLINRGDPNHFQRPGLVNPFQIAFLCGKNGDGPKDLPQLGWSSTAWYGHHTQPYAAYECSSFKNSRVNMLVIQASHECSSLTKHSHEQWYILVL